MGRLASKAFTVFLVVILTMELTLFLNGLLFTPSDPIRLSYWIVQDEDVYRQGGLSLWSWLTMDTASYSIAGHPNRGHMVKGALFYLCLSVGIHVAIVAWSGVVFCMGILARRNFKFFAQKRWSLVLSVSFVVSTLTCFIPPTIYYFCLLRALDFNHWSFMQQGPSFYGWCISLALHLSSVYLSLRALERSGSVLKLKTFSVDGGSGGKEPTGATSWGPPFDNHNGYIIRSVATSPEEKLNQAGLIP